MNTARVSSELEEMILRRKKEFYYVNGDSIRCIIDSLKFLYYSVIASENLISCAIEQLKMLDHSIYRDNLLSYFYIHLEEERGHDEWLANDLEAHGVDISGYDCNAMAMIGSQYYMIYHRHPCCLLGYMAVVEGTPTPIEEIEKLERAYGRRLFRFARFHAIKDQEHKVDLFNQIDNVPSHNADDILTSANITLEYIAKAAKQWA